MACSKPIISNVPGEAARLLAESRAGRPPPTAPTPWLTRSWTPAANEPRLSYPTGTNDRRVEQQGSIRRGEATDENEEVRNF